MSDAISIRRETPDDIPAIHDLTKRAFANAPHTSHTEHLIVDALRDRRALSLSLVAELPGHGIVGHIAFSHVSVEGHDYGWYGLGPVSVDPEFQRRGIGSSLISDGLKRLKGIGARGCVLVGDPGFYQRFGFAPLPDLSYPDLPSEYFMGLAFGKTQPSGTVAFDPAFDVQA